MSDYHKARRRVDITVGESVRIIRELQELSQNELSALTGIPQSTISAIERDKINLGVNEQRCSRVPSRSTPPSWCFRVGMWSVNPLPNRAVPVDRNPRERGSYPLNANR